MNDNRQHYKMIDVGDKAITRRVAVASGRIVMNAETFAMVRDGTLPKGDPLRLAEVAGVLAAKKTPEIIPLCHPLGLDQVRVAFRLDAADSAVTAFCQASSSARTGVEMEALAGVNGALLTIWDLAKQVQPDLAIEGIRLLLKTGGKSGRYEHPDGIGELPEGFGS
ncbi:cyclic pyranopterin monophosphate synthase MoaC [Wenzhouxiangella sp. AB-CW3]|uniref:cyclic pyranopterin monophosphate synthase MoaC n=1 Tax=Wenzhouxiangella sp. AB-CW3 TaxID=2771012 RepID=UPI00168A8CCA|nr:cyclic pyranopterin monophosphate synthase MoaC [Wenzhouxiangella sp. AB-CW3]QOC22454.1 cyclic pyranopterin monophosphate synthase MoaC [Wenzhouxiangella sp. AB-CW3]